MSIERKIGNYNKGLNAKDSERVEDIRNLMSKEKMSSINKAIEKEKGEKREVKYEKVFGTKMKIGSKAHSRALQDKKHFDDLAKSER